MPGGDSPAFVMGRIGASGEASTEAATMTGTSGVMTGLETPNSLGKSSDSGASSVGDTPLPGYQLMGLCLDGNVPASPPSSLGLPILRTRLRRSCGTLP